MEILQGDRSITLIILKRNRVESVIILKLISYFFFEEIIKGMFYLPELSSSTHLLEHQDDQ